MAHVDRFAGEFDTVLAAAQRDAPWALERIFRALSPVVAGYLRVQGATEPDDLCSEVFVAVVRNLQGFSGDEAGFRSWVFTIAHRRLLDERRSLARRPATIQLTEAVELPASGHDVADTVERPLGVDWVRDVCDRLAPDQRDVLLLRLLGRLTIDEIAATLGKSPEAVKALQRRGFRAAGRILDREDYEEVAR
jgi:RNA polymerase sigma factor (sigma-70 family)